MVQGVDGRGGHAQQAGAVGDQVHTAGPGAGAVQAGGEQGVGEAGGGLVLGHVAGLEPGGDDGVAAGGAEGVDGGGVEGRALLQHQAGKAVGVGEDGAQRLVERGGAEDQAGCLRTATSWAMMLSAISPAVTAPMSRPTGPRMRARAWSPWPMARRRSSRAAWVLREPRAPT